MLSKRLCLLLCATYLVLLTGCYDINEIDDMVHILAIGVDKGVSDKWRLTIQFPTLNEPTQKSENMIGSKNDQGGYSTATVDAPSFYTGIDMLNVSLPRRINLMHAEYLVISEEFAKTGLLGEFIAPIIRFRQTRRSMNVIISKGAAMEFVNANKSIIGTTLSKNMQLLTKEADITGFFPKVTLNDFYEGLKSTYNQPIAALGAVNDFSSFKIQGEKKQPDDVTGGEYYAGELPRSGNNGMELFGTAVFDGDRMVAELDGYETRLMLIARGDFKTAFLNVKDPIEPEFIVPIDLRQARQPDVKVEFLGDKPVITLGIHLEGDIMSVQSRINYEDPKMKPIVEKAVEQQVKNGLDKLILKSKSLGVDIFNFGRTAVRHFKTIQEWEDYNWLEQYKNVEVAVEVEFNIRRSGTQLKSSPITSSKGNE